VNVQTESWPRPHRLTVDEYYRMAEVGLLAPDARVELIEGEIIDMAPIGSSHGAAVIELTRRLVTAVGELALVAVQLPVHLGIRSEPQPDFALLRPREDAYRKGLPTAADVLLLIEVSDTTLAFDLGAKAKLYARHGVPELWVVDVVREELHVLRTPRGDEYTDRAAGAVGVMPLPGLHVTVDLTKLF
jgi:Uma2 family endonuclease